MNVNPSRLAILSVLLAVGLNGMFALYFMVDPLGLSPVLDGRENFAWARWIAAGELPPEPFYRALLYPAILALFAKVGLLSGAVATAFGVTCHLLSAWLTGLIARRIWRRDAAAWCAGLLYALYPVAMWFSVQVLDISFAITLFLAAFWLLLRAYDEGRSRSAWCGALIAAGLAGGAAVLVRPNFLPAVLLLPCLPLLLRWVGGGVPRWSEGGASLLLAVVLGGVLLLQGLLNLRIGGEFRILPWQGAYNLYAGNREGANGKFYQQRVNFEALPEGMNTTRAESEYFYREAVATEAKPSVSAMNTYWRGRLVEEVAAEPLRWLGLMGRKVFYVFNDWEQYNNLTYAFHKERFPILRLNPLGWGVLVLAAFAGIALGWPQLDKRRAGALALLIAAYTAGLLLFFVSARFRLPLAAPLSVFAGGLVYFSAARIRGLGGARGCILATVGCLLALLCYGNWFEAKSRESFIQDELLLATASMAVGEDLLALENAEAVLVRDPERIEAQRIRLSALYNLWLQAVEPGERAAWWSQMEVVAEAIARPDAAAVFIRGVLAWRNGQAAAAVGHWTEGVARFGPLAVSCQQALQAVGEGLYFETNDPGVEVIRRILEVRESP